MGDGNLHYNVQAPEGDLEGVYLRMHQAEISAKIYDAVGRYGGSISAEHGIGTFRIEEFSVRKDPVALATMRKIEGALDPQWILNPSCLLPQS